MTATKRKISVSIDQDLIVELEAGGEAVSSQVNDAVRTELPHRRRQRLLGEMLDELEQVIGPPDEQVVQKYVELLG